MTCKLPATLESNGAFSRVLPGFQTCIDSTSLGEFKICPYRYFLSIICGYEPVFQSVHLTFGLLMHEARERYYTARASGSDHEDALGAAVGDRSRLYKPGGLKELREQGMVDHNARLGFFRPDCPPQDLEA